MSGPLRLLTRFAILAAAGASVAYGLLAWQHLGFSLDGLWLVDNDWRLHPLHFLVVGIGLIPPAMWEIFAMDVRAREQRAVGEGRTGSGRDG